MAVFAVSHSRADAGLSLAAASTAFDLLGTGIHEASSALHMLAGHDSLQPNQVSALRAIVTLLDDLSEDAAKSAERFGLRAAG